ncbi:XRE family transcriptional regulator [Lactiplantibacillus garii]|uniref:XRE family transcriptional regulator n=1 Tax=Lactiplantibacillus garii TaxID=2306423 RepID=A0A3R8KMU4_9LACO|nr:helix-turn-helix transcriptional regulator [Lactiplantibacillus garii]RRK11295.1 XRE family transcriptional regulator [Lactiplantibacillus garii]
MTIEFNKQLGRLRRERGLSQEDLAQQLYLSRQSISKWEQGETTPDLTTLVKLAAVLNVGLDELVLGQQPSPAIPPAEPTQPHHHRNYRPMNGWEFFARYWWLIFAIAGMINWFIRE